MTPDGDTLVISASSAAGAPTSIVSCMCARLLPPQTRPAPPPLLAVGAIADEDFLAAHAHGNGISA